MQLVDTVTGNRSTYTGPYTLHVLAGGTSRSQMETFDSTQKMYAVKWHAKLFPHPIHTILYIHNHDSDISEYRHFYISTLWNNCILGMFYLLFRESEIWSVSADDILSHTSNKIEWECKTVIVYLTPFIEFYAAGGPVGWVAHVVRSYLEKGAVQSTTCISRHPTGPQGTQDTL